MGRIQIWKSASSEWGIEAMLAGGGLEKSIGGEELAAAICNNKSVALVSQLGEYAKQFPESRQMIVEALEMASGCECAKVIRMARRSVSEILALSMVEAFAPQ
ncbi:MAG: hypothetical protein KGH53_01790 [Candidatus Micrarchaeota archaeon]|nr:hypothetical protein [Candidatus Micrarchaeota archaeon]